MISESPLTNHGNNACNSLEQSTLKARAGLGRFAQQRSAVSYPQHIHNIPTGLILEMREPVHIGLLRNRSQAQKTRRVEAAGF